jgi:hypothetical protein
VSLDLLDYFIIAFLLNALLLLEKIVCRLNFINRSPGLIDDVEMQSNLLSYGTCRLTLTKKANANFTNEFKRRIIDVFKYFPELHDQIVLVGWIAPNGWARGSCSRSSARASKPLKISLQPNERNFTIAHEFTHLLQARKKEELQIPSGERACDVWTLTRLPLELIDDYPSYIGNYLMRMHWDNIKKAVRELAFDAIEIRKTKRQYIVWFEDEIKKSCKNNSSK